MDNSQRKSAISKVVAREGNDSRVKLNSTNSPKKDICAMRISQCIIHLFQMSRSITGCRELEKLHLRGRLAPCIVASPKPILRVELANRPAKFWLCDMDFHTRCCCVTRRKVWGWGRGNLSSSPDLIKSGCLNERNLVVVRSSQVYKIGFCLLK